MNTELRRVSTDTTVTDRPTFLRSVILAGGSAAGTVTIRNGAGGTEVLTLAAPIGASAVWNTGAPGPVLSEGLRVEVTGTGAIATVEFS